MLELIVYNPAFGEPTGSPFTNKALCLLERSGQPYTVKHTNDPRKMPKAKLPVLQHGGKLISSQTATTSATIWKPLSPSILTLA